MNQELIFSLVSYLLAFLFTTANQPLTPNPLPTASQSATIAPTVTATPIFPTPTPNISEPTESTDLSNCYSVTVNGETVSDCTDDDINLKIINGEIQTN